MITSLGANPWRTPSFEMAPWRDTHNSAPTSENHIHGILRVSVRRRFHLLRQPASAADPFLRVERRRAVQRPPNRVYRFQIAPRTWPGGLRRQDGGGGGSPSLLPRLPHVLKVSVQLSLRLQGRAARGNEIPVFHALAHARLPNLELHLETVGQVDLLAFAPRVAPSAASPFLLYIYVYR